MKFKPIIIVAGEPNSVFSEIFIKTFKNHKFNSPIILICSKKLFLKQAKALKKKIKFNEIDNNLISLKNTEHMHFYSVYIGNHQGLDKKRIIRLCNNLDKIK